MENDKTDLERFVELYKSFGIDCKVNIAEKDGQLMHVNKDDRFILIGDYYDNKHETTGSDKFTGYPSFYSDVVFDKDGKFKTQGFWE